MYSCGSMPNNDNRFLSLCLSWHCYAQVAKSPNDHQGADVQCKSKRVFITKLELGLPPLPTQQLWEGAPSFGLHCLYRVYSCEGISRLEDVRLVTLFRRVVCWFLIGSYYLGKPQISEHKVRRFWSEVWLAPGWWGEVRGFSVSFLEL